VEGSTPPGRRTLTPAVLASALFVAVCAVFAVTFVAARGGLSMPIAPTGSAAAVASLPPSTEPSEPAATTPAPTGSPAPTPLPTTAPTAPPTEAPSPTPAGTPDPLTALPGCPDLPGCYEYLIQRYDTLSGVASRYVIPVRVVLALNPEIGDSRTIVVGHVLYLGRDPFLRLRPCDAEPDCSLYTVQPGDRLSTIAGRFGLTLDAVLAANPEITEANTIVSGQVIRLPHPPSQPAT
jgi:LysM repeat protein